MRHGHDTGIGKAKLIYSNFIFMYFKTIRKERNSLTFTQFSRKGWSLFACLGREVRIGVLSAATLATAAPCIGATTVGIDAPSDSLRAAAGQDGLELAEAVVSGTRAPLAADVAARQVVTLSREDFAAAAGITCIGDILKLATGVDVRQRGAFGMQTDLSINGGTFDQIAILLNGVPLNNPQTGHNASDFPINISDIERIEILEGAASRVFGSQAFSGAINIVTRTASLLSHPAFADSCKRMAWQGEAEAQGGSYGTAMAEAASRFALTGGRGGCFVSSLSAGYRRSDGAVDNGDFDGYKAYWQGIYDDARLRLDVQTGFTLIGYGANTFYSAAYPDQWEQTRRHFLSARAESKAGRVRLSGQVSWLRNADHYQLVRDTPKGENFHLSDVYTASVNAWTKWKLGRTALGAEVREEDIFSTNLGHALDKSQQPHIAGTPDGHYTKRDGRTNVSYYLEHNVVWRGLTVSAGVMAQRNSALSTGFRFYPGVDVSYRPAKDWRLYASFNRSLRLPSFTDLWYKSPTQEGNVGLRPEECSAYRIGADFGNSWLSVKVKGQYARGTDMIDWVMLTPTDVYRSRNFSLDNYGAGIDAAINFSALLGSRQPLRRLTLSYARLWQNRRDAEPYFKSNYAMEYLRDKFTASLSHKLFASLSAQWSLRVWHREGAYQIYENLKATDRLQPYGTHALLDCKVTWQKPRYELFADLTNITNHRYFDLGNVPQPGFMAMAGAKIKW